MSHKLTGPSKLLFGFFFGLILGGSVLVYADAFDVNTATIPYTGWVDNNGVPVNNTLTKMNFAFYLEANCSGDPTWKATNDWPQQGVDVTPYHGRFSVELGATGQNNLTKDLFNNAVIYLQIAIAGTKLTGCQKIVPSRMASSSQRSDNFTVTTLNVTGNTNLESTTVDGTLQTRNIDIRPVNNVALLGTAEQNNTYGKGIASRAIDGNPVTTYENDESGSMTHTKSGSTGEWEVKLDKEYNIIKIKTYNRAILLGRSVGLSVEIYAGETIVYNSADSAPDISQEENTIYEFLIPNITGDKVKVIAAPDQILSLGEVEVFQDATNVESPGILYMNQAQALWANNGKYTETHENPIERKELVINRNYGETEKNRHFFRDVSIKGQKVTVGANLNVTGNTTLKATTVGGNLDVTGNTTLKATTVGGNLDVTGRLKIGDQTLGAFINQQARSWVHANCYIALGWKDSSNDDADDPEKIIRVQPNGTIKYFGKDFGNSSDADDYDDSLDTEEGTPIKLGSFTLDGNVQGDDRFYIGFKCN